MCRVSLSLSLTVSFSLSCKSFNVPFKEKEVKRHLVEAFLQVARSQSLWSFIGSQPRILGLAETFEVLVLIDLKREEKVLEEKKKPKEGPVSPSWAFFLPQGVKSQRLSLINQMVFNSNMVHIV